MACAGGGCFRAPTWGWPFTGRPTTQSRPGRAWAFSASSCDANPAQPTRNKPPPARGPAVTALIPPATSPAPATPDLPPRRRRRLADDELDGQHLAGLGRLARARRRER